MLEMSDVKTYGVTISDAVVLDWNVSSRHSTYAMFKASASWRGTFPPAERTFLISPLTKLKLLFTLRGLN